MIGSLVYEFVVLFIPGGWTMPLLRYVFLSVLDCLIFTTMEEIQSSDKNAFYKIIGN